MTNEKHMNQTTKIDLVENQDSILISFLEKRNNQTSKIDLVENEDRLKKSIINDIINSTLIISETLSEEQFLSLYKTNFNLMEYIEFLKNLRNDDFLILYNVFNDSNYIDDIYFPTDNKYVKTEFIIQLLTPYFYEKKDDKNKLK
jgi:hypothetical protein